MEFALAKAALSFALSAVVLAGCGGSENSAPLATPTQGVQTITSPSSGELAATYSIAAGAPNGLVVTLVASQTAPPGVPAPTSLVRAKQSGTDPISVILYVTLTVNEAVSASLFGTETIPIGILPGLLNPAATYTLEIDDPALAAPKLLTIPGTQANGILTFVNAAGSGPGLTTLLAAHPYVFQFYVNSALAPAPTTTPTPTPSATPQGEIVLGSSALALNGAGSSNAQPLQISENNYTGSFIESDTCAGIATILPTSLRGPAASVTVTGVASGTCATTFTDTFGQTAFASIVATVTDFGVQSNARQEAR